MQRALLYVVGAITIAAFGLTFLAIVIVMAGTLLGNLAIWPIIGAALIGYTTPTTSASKLAALMTSTICFCLLIASSPKMIKSLSSTGACIAISA